MLKLALVAASASLGTAFFFAGPRTTYSALQGQLPFGTAIKVTPDGSNVWSWHQEITKTGDYEVLVDFDKDGKMDSGNACFRVLVTDIQTSIRVGDGYHYGPTSDGLSLDAENGWRWMLGTPKYPTWQGSNELLSATDHLTKPLVVPTGSKLLVRANLHQGTSSGQKIYVTLIGRVVSL